MRFTQLLRKAEEVLIKTSIGNPTGLTGIAQHPTPRPALISIYKATLKNLETKFPTDSIYRQSASNFTNERLKIVESEEIVEKIEQRIGNGLIEELIIQANDEFELSNKLAEWKCWEELEEKPLDDQWVYFGKRSNQ